MALSMRLLTEVKIYEVIIYGGRINQNLKRTCHFKHANLEVKYGNNNRSKSKNVYVGYPPRDMAGKLWRKDIAVINRLFKEKF